MYREMKREGFMDQEHARGSNLKTPAGEGQLSGNLSNTMKDAIIDQSKFFTQEKQRQKFLQTFTDHKKTGR